MNRTNVITVTTATKISALSSAPPNFCPELSPDCERVGRGGLAQPGPALLPLAATTGGWGWLGFDPGIAAAPAATFAPAGHVRGLGRQLLACARRGSSFERTFSSYAIEAMYTDCESVAPEGLSTRTRNTVMAMHSDTGAAIPVTSSPKSSSVLRPILAAACAAGCDRLLPSTPEHAAPGCAGPSSSSQSFQCWACVPGPWRSEVNRGEWGT
jgi:hypothetical protein